MGAGQAEGELMRGMHFRARAPLRIGLAGGGTDVDPYATEKGGVVFNTTINKFAYCTVVPTDDHAMSVHSSEYGDSRVDLGSGPLPLDGNTSLANVVANHFDIKDGFSMTLESEAPPGSGLGGSSTVIVSIISAVCKWLDKRMSGKDLAKLAYDLERKELGLKGGRQDQYAAVYGGFNIMRFKGDDVTIDSVPVAQDVVNELQARTLLCYTGKSRESADVIDSQVKAYEKGSNEKALDASKKIALDMAKAVEKGDITEAGELLHTSWQYKKDFSSKISNPMIDRMYKTAMDAGAIGGKVSGAGGGGFMFFICDYDRKYNVAKAIRTANEDAVVTDFMFEPRGVTSWRYPNDRSHIERALRISRRHLPYRPFERPRGRRRPHRGVQEGQPGDIHGQRRFVCGCAAHRRRVLGQVLHRPPRPSRGMPFQHSPRDGHRQRLFLRSRVQEADRGILP